MDAAMMADFVSRYQDKHDRYPTDWAVMSYDAVYALKQGIEKAGSIDSEAVKDTLRGMEIDTCRGKLFFREIDNQLSCSAYFGRVADDSRYSIPVYKDLLEIKGPEIWRPAAEISAARSKP
jgi:branched-chain amino acid transport system substrate-binding protein